VRPERNGHEYIRCSRREINTATAKCAGRGPTTRGWGCGTRAHRWVGRNKLFDAEPRKATVCRETAEGLKLSTLTATPPLLAPPRVRRIRSSSSSSSPMTRAYVAPTLDGNEKRVPRTMACTNSPHLVDISDMRPREAPRAGYSPTSERGSHVAHVRPNETVGWNCCRLTLVGAAELVGRYGSPMVVVVVDLKTHKLRGSAEGKTNLGNAMAQPGSDRNNETHNNTGITGCCQFPYRRMRHS